jgi:predicted nucleic acid-binding protein
VRSILVDAGPVIALFDSDDAHHTAMKDLHRDAVGRLITTWPVVTEASHMLDFHARAQRDLYRWVAAGGVAVHDVPQDALEWIIELVEKYGDRPMDLADATLVVAAETLGIREIVSIDRDFDIDPIDGRTGFEYLYSASG